MPPSTIGRYQIEEELAQGGMGIVYRAQDPKLRRKVAIKLLHTMAPAERSEELQRRLLSEAQAMARLSHPNVVPVFDVGEVDGQVFIAMELVEGQALDQWLAAAARPLPEVL